MVNSGDPPSGKASDEPPNVQPPNDDPDSDQEDLEAKRIDNVIRMLDRTPINPLNWLRGLLKNNVGAILPVAWNVSQILENSDEYAGMLAYSEFTSEPIMLKPPPLFAGHAGYPRPWAVADVVAVQNSLQRDWMPRVAVKTVAEAFHYVAQTNSSHPVRDYFNGLVWDGAPRIHNWLSRGFGVAESPLASQAGAMWLVAGVRRIFSSRSKI